MLKQPSPVFRAFLERLQRASAREYGMFLPKVWVDKTLKYHLAGNDKALAEEGAAIIEYLENEYNSLGMNESSSKEINASIKKIEELDVQFACSEFMNHAYGWRIGDTFIRVTKAYNDLPDADGNVFKNKSRPFVLAGINSIHHQDMKRLALETTAYIDRIDNSNLLDIEPQDLQNLIHFNVAVIEHIGYKSINEEDLVKPEDVGIRFFSMKNQLFCQKPQIDHLSATDCGKVRFQKNEFITQEGMKVMGVPYLFDTYDFKENISKEEQLETIQEILDSGVLPSKLDEIPLPKLLKMNLLQCYMAFECMKEESKEIFSLERTYKKSQPVLAAHNAF